MKDMINELNSTKVPIVKINETLKVFKDNNPFWEKLERMNDILSESGMPEGYYEPKDHFLETPIVTVNHGLSKYEASVAKKLARANEIIEKWGLPKEWEDEIREREREQAFWIKGTLSQADIDTHSFLIVVEATDNQPQMTYTITALSDVLNKLVKEYWGYVVNVHIKPKKETQGQYEFIDVA